MRSVGESTTMRSASVFATTFIPDRARSAAVLAALLAALTSGCASRAQLAWVTADWPREVPGGLSVIETPSRGPLCTASVIGNAGTSAYVLTARHCVVSREPGHPVQAFGVAIPELRSGSRAWLHLAANRVLIRPDLTSILHDKGPGGPPGDWALSDWAIVETTPPRPLPTMRLASPEMTAKLRPLERVTLLSFFDGDFKNLYPHGHEAPWGELDDDFVQGGHSGSPVVSSEGIIATFTGARIGFHIRTWFAISRKLTFTSLETIRSEASQCGFAIDDPGAPPADSTHVECWHPVPAKD
jgi:V8-like Glu-specific endopeptidase